MEPTRQKQGMWILPAVTWQKCLHHLPDLASLHGKLFVLRTSMPDLVCNLLEMETVCDAYLAHCQHSENK